MASIKIYGSPFSTAAMRVLGCAYEKELDFEFVPVNMAAGEHKKEPFISINPFGQVPGFEDGDLKLFESRAITKYISFNYADKGTQLLPKDTKKMGIAFTWMEVESNHYDSPASKLTWEQAIKPMLGMGGADKEAVEENEAKLAKVLDVYENQLSHSKYLAGDSFTLADLHHLPTLTYLMGTDSKKVFELRPHVKAWVDDIMARPAWSKVLAMRK